MVDDPTRESADSPAEAAAEPPKKPRAKRAKKASPAVDTVADATLAVTTDVPVEAHADSGDTPAPAKKTRTRARKAAAPKQKPDAESPATPDAESAGAESAGAGSDQSADQAGSAKKPRRASRSRKTTVAEQPIPEAVEEQLSLIEPEEDATAEEEQEEPEAASAIRPAATALLFQAPDPTAARPVRRSRRSPAAKAEESAPTTGPDEEVEEPTDEIDESVDLDASVEGDSDDAEGPGRRRRRRGGRRRRRAGDDSAEDGEETDEASADALDTASDAEDANGEAGSRRRRRRRRAGDDNAETSDDPENTVTRVRVRRSAEDEITAVSGSTRLEAKKQRRREGREAGRRRAPIVSEAEFLARRESVDRVMVIRQRGGLTQIAVLEDKVLVEHYVAQESQTSLIGNVYLGRVQNVLPSMEAAFIDIGKGRNAVLYAGEVNWSALGHKDGQPRKIESVLSSGQSVLVQVTKDPVGHKGARLTSQISLAGRFLVYVPDGTTSGISRKLPDTERNRLKRLLKDIVPDTAGVIVRTAAEGASEDELTRDVERLKARWEDIEAKVAKGNAPTLLYGEPDLTLKVVRDLFTEDFGRLIIEGDDAWDTVQGYVAHVAPDLEERLERFQGGGGDVFSAYRIDEQIHKGLDRKVWLPSGGSLVIDRTEAMTVVDVNTGKFTGSGGNLEETVTRNNLEAAEEIVRQLRLRDIGGIIVVDFIDMVLESNRDLVLRRLVECLGRDRTRHQVAEVTSLGLVQMTRKRIGTGLLEAFSETCEHCSGRGLVLTDLPVEPRRGDDERRPTTRRRRGGRGDSGGNANGDTNGGRAVPSPRDIAAVARPDAEPILVLDALPGEDPEDLPHADPTPPGEHVEHEVDVDGADVEVESLDFENDVETPDDAESLDSDDLVPFDEGSSVAAEEPAAEPTPELPPPPRVVTRTRRRAASRAAGPPAALEEPAAIVPEPVAVDPDATGAPEIADPELVGDQESGDEPHLVEHVPIKRKGARKR